jgi:hypothetical protein
LVLPDNNIVRNVFTAEGTQLNQQLVSIFPMPVDKNQVDYVRWLANESQIIVQFYITIESKLENKVFVLDFCDSLQQ